MSTEEVGKSWYTKYRPSTIEDYLGDEIKNIVKKRFSKRSNMPHVILAHGKRGCGKTTLARILSKYYLCENPHEDGTPCEECDMCQSINEILIGGESGQVDCPGVTEIDATVMNGKEAIQEVLDDAMQQPVYSQYKVLIVDEVHMVTNAAQNSMLKIIEDIPNHLIVIFATTNPEKVLQTIKSRCQLIIEVKKQSVKDMAFRLMVISKLEGLTISTQAIEAIARKGNRVPRECINLLESIAKTYDGAITVDNVKDYIGGVSSDLYLEYFKSANSSLPDILLFLKKIKELDIKTVDFVAGLMQFALDSMYIKHGISLEEYPTDYIKSIKQLFEMYNSSDFDMLLQMLDYLSHNIDNDETAKNEVLLTITAMRIGKIELLANGLANEQSHAITENKDSLFEHSKKLQVDNEAVAEQLKIDITPQEINDTFENITQISNTQNLFDEVDESKLPQQEYVEEKVEEVPNVSSDIIDSFFDN